MRRSLIFTIVIFFLLKVQSQTHHLVWTAYDTSSKIDVRKFAALTKLEADFTKILEDFANNRARLTLTDNGNRISPNELQRPDFPLPCECVLKKDTIFITTALGMMSGLGIRTAVHKDQFTTTFFQEADNTPVFKVKESDSSYVDRISVPAYEQRLTFFKKPSFLDNETIIGTFQGQFQKFYEFDTGSEPPLTRNYKAELFFKCRLHLWTN